MPKAASCSSDCLTRSAALVSDRVAVSAAKISTAANAGAMLRKNDRDFDVTMIVSRAIRVSDDTLLSLIATTPTPRRAAWRATSIVVRS